MVEVVYPLYVLILWIYRKTCLVSSEWTNGRTFHPFKHCSHFASRISYKDKRKKYTVCYLSVHYHLNSSLIIRRREKIESTVQELTTVWTWISRENIRRLLSATLQKKVPVTVLRFLFFIEVNKTFKLRSIRSRIIPELSAGAFRLCEAEIHSYNLTPDHAGARSSAVSTI